MACVDVGQRVHAGESVCMWAFFGFCVSGFLRRNAFTTSSNDAPPVGFSLSASEPEIVMTSSTKNSRTDINEAMSQEMDHIAKVLGYIANSWNMLHADDLGAIFVYLLKPRNATIGWAAWHARQNDRAQRYMLQAAAKEALGEDNKIFKELKWSLKRTEALEDKRNTAIHTPYSIFIDNGTLRIVPYFFTGHKRAETLKERDVERELISYWRNIERIRSFVLKLYDALHSSSTSSTLPPRPSLLKAGQGQDHKDKGRHKTPK